MQIFAALIGLLLVGVILRDAFETIIVPRRVSARYRVSKLFYQATWQVYSSIGRRIKSADRRETFLGSYGPLSLIFLFILWGVVLIAGYGLLLWATDVAIGSNSVYMSGTTFTTLGIGDFTPKTALSKLVTVVEAGTGFGFFAVLISYLPVLYQSFSRREVQISMLDEWAGSPPSAGELLQRAISAGEVDELVRLMERFEPWTAELLESHLSYQVLAYFRSQHENQSWLAALTAILDLSALQQASGAGKRAWSSRRVYAMGRHAFGDLSQVLRATPDFDAPDRMSEAELGKLYELLTQGGVKVERAAFAERLSQLRKGYEPYAIGLSRELLMDLPPWMPLAPRHDNWETTAWEGAAPGLLH